MSVTGLRPGSPGCDAPSVFPRPPLSTPATATGEDLLAEVHELRDTIRAMRAELERAHAERKSAIEEAGAGARAEIRELRATIQALRVRLEEQDRRLAVAEEEAAVPGGGAD